MSAFLYLAVVLAFSISMSEADNLVDAANLEERAVPEDSKQFSDQEPKVKQVRDAEGQDAWASLDLDPSQGRMQRQLGDSNRNTILDRLNSVDYRLTSLSSAVSSQSSLLTSINSAMIRQQGLLNTIRAYLPRQSASSVNVRLVNSSIRSQGRVEISVNGGAWGTVCDDDWDNNDATVVCRMMGYRSGTARSSAFFGEGTGSIWLDDVNCTGTETNIVNCRLPPFGVHNCNHSEDAGAICSY